ncbi:hypothetical protein ABN584_05550 [Gloeocapsa sp. BRSZ]
MLFPLTLLPIFPGTNLPISPMSCIETIRHDDDRSELQLEKRNGIK